MDLKARLIDGIGFRREAVDFDVSLVPAEVCRCCFVLKLRPIAILNVLWFVRTPLVLVELVQSIPNVFALGILKVLASSVYLDAMGTAGERSGWVGLVFLLNASPLNGELLEFMFASSRF